MYSKCFKRFMVKQKKTHTHKTLSSAFRFGYILEFSVLVCRFFLCLCLSSWHCWDESKHYFPFGRFGLLVNLGFCHFEMCPMSNCKHSNCEIDKIDTENAITIDRYHTHNAIKFHTFDKCVFAIFDLWYWESLLLFCFEDGRWVDFMFVLFMDENFLTFIFWFSMFLSFNIPMRNVNEWITHSYSKSFMLIIWFGFGLPFGDMIRFPDLFCTHV